MLSLSVLCISLFAAETLGSTFTWPYWTFKSVPFRPPELDIVRTSNEEPAPGLLFIGPKKNEIDGMLTAVGATSTIYDQAGNLIWKGPDVLTTNVQVQTLFGEPVLTYWSGQAVEGYGYGRVHILDRSYKEIYTVELTGDYNVPDGIEGGSYIDLHESKITDRNTILVTSYNLTQIDATPVGGQPDTWAIKPAFHEIEIGTNRVLFSWSPIDKRGRATIPLSASRLGVPVDTASPKAPWDIYHINSVELAASGYIVSLRHTFSVSYIKWDGSVLWHLDGETGGDFDLCRSCTFAWQHDIRGFHETPQGITLTMFNNNGREVEGEKRPSWGLVLALDLNTMTVREEQRLVDPDEVIRSATQGNFQLLDSKITGNRFVGYGSWATLREFNASGALIWTARFGPENAIASYRSFKFDWHATPWYPPVVLATAYQSPSKHMSTHFYISWNGATEVTRWNLYAQSTGRNATSIFITSVRKTGFETMLIVDGYLDRILVEAIDVNGTALARTPVQRTVLHGDWDRRTKKRPLPDDPSTIAAAIAKAASTHTVENHHTVESTPGLNATNPEPTTTPSGYSRASTDDTDGTVSDSQTKVIPTLPHELRVPLGFCAVSLIVITTGGLCLTRRSKRMRYCRIPVLPVG